MKRSTAALIAILALTVAAKARAGDFTVTKVEDTQDGVCDADCSLREAVEAANVASEASTITLPSGVYQLKLPNLPASIPPFVVSTDEDANADGDLDVTNEITIVGEGALTTVIDANGAVLDDRVFDVDPGVAPGAGASLTLVGVTVGGGRLSNNGGGIRINNHGTVRLTDSLLANNEAVGSYGGGIYAADLAAIVIDHSQIIDNIAGLAGGGIYTNDGASVIISNGSSVSSNEAADVGGGIYVYGGSLNVMDSRIDDNTADGSGGGIYNGYTATKLENTEVKGNKSTTNGGGGIYNAYTLDLDNCLIAENQALDDYEGGGIYNDDLVNVKDSTITKNRAEYNGGGIYSNAGSAGYYLVIENSTISQNISDVDNDDGSSCGGNGGGGVYSSGIAVITGSLLTGNVATTCNGGGIFMADNTIIESSAITDNTTSDGDGGGLHNDCDILVVRDSTFSGNKARGDSGGGGAFDAQGGGIFSYCAGDVYNTTIVGNEADGSGGGFYDSSDIISLNNVTVAFNTADADNDGDGSGGGLFVDDYAIDLQNSIVAGNVDGSAGLGSPDCATTDSTSTDEAIVTSGVNIIQNPTGCEILGDTAGVLNVDPLLDPSGLSDNAGTNAGDSEAPVVVQTVNLQASSPAIDAGVDSTCRVTDGRGVDRPQDGNSDGESHCDLGALEVQSGGAATTGGTGGDTTGGDTTGGTTGGSGDGGGCSLTTGSASSGLGIGLVSLAALAVLSLARKGSKKMSGAFNASIMTLMVSLFFATGAHAATTWHVTDLGDAAAPLPGQLRFILQNGALSDGDLVVFDVDGTITLAAGQLEISKTITLQGNGSDNTIIDGAATSRIFEIDPSDTEGNSVTFTGLTIQNGKSTTSGGGIRINGSDTVHLDGCVVKDNEVTAGSNHGGGVALEDQNAILTVFNSTISGNKVTGPVSDGGGISNYYGSLYLRNSTIDANEATGRGGGVYADDGGTEIVDTKITNNISDSDSNGASGSAGDEGGGVHNQYSGMTITGTGDGSACLIDGNKTNADAGGGIYNGASLIVENCTISNNQALSVGAGYGGGIYNEDIGTLHLMGVSVGKNTADIDGGGIYNEGLVFIEDSDVSENTSTGSGGGVYNDYSLTLARTDITKNVSTTGYGGGIYQNDYAVMDTLTLSENEASANQGGGMYVNYPTVIRNSLISKNKTAGAFDGGGVFENDQLNLSNSTVANNESGANGGGIFVCCGYSGSFNNVTFAFNTAAGDGGGLYVDDGGGNPATALLSNSVLSKNTAAGSGPDCFDDFTAQASLLVGGPNIIDDTTGCDLRGAASEVSDEDPLLTGTEPADNGGPTLTIALGDGSSALDAGNDGTCEKTDQRGIERPQGDHCDLGAFELEVSGGTTGGTTGGTSGTTGGTTAGTTGGASDSGGCSLIR